jgi:iron complex outermembrane receptor protein
MLVPVILHAQVTLHGTVVDQQTGAPLVGAVVTITGGPAHASTDGNGNFTLAAPVSISSVTVTRAGYATKTVLVADPTQPLRVGLTATATELPGLQVTATQPEPSTARINRADLDRFDGISLSDALNTQPGVFMQSRTPFGGAHIDIRGYYPSVGGNSPNSNQMGDDIFLNGIPITDASGAAVLDDIDYGTLGSVQVIKGPASSLYGSAIGGTVLMQTERPTPNQTSVGEQFLGGGDGLLRSTTTLEGDNGSSDYALHYGDQQYNSWRPHSQSRKTYASAIGDFHVAPNQTVNTFFSYNKSSEQLAGEIDSSDYYARSPVSDANYLANNSHIAITSFFTGVGDTYRISDRFSNQTSVFGSGRFDDQPFAHGFTDATQFNFGVRSAFDYHALVGHVGVNGTLGVMAQRSNVTSNGVFIIPAPPYVERPSASQNHAVNSFVFTEWKFAFEHGITATAGGSLINNSFGVQNLLKSGQLFDTTTTVNKSFGAVFAPRVELTKGLGENALAYASVSTGYTPPLLSNVVSSDGSLNTSLKPEKAIQYEVGIQGTLVARLNATAALFDLDNTNKLVSQTVNSITSTINVGEQRNEGAELSLSWALLSNASGPVSQVRPWVSYTYTDAKYIDFKSDANNTAATVDFSGNYVARVPKDRYAVGIDAASRGGFSVHGTYQYVGRVPVTFDNSTWVRSYSLLSAKVDYDVRIHDQWMLNLTVGGDNLGSTTNYTFLFVGPNYKGLAQGPDGGSGDGYILPGNPSAQYYATAGLSYAIK